MQLNNAKKVSALKYAISDSDVEKEIYVNPTHSGAATIESKGFGHGVEIISCASSVTIEKLLNLDEGLDIFVKIDTEGHEPTVINELRKTYFWNEVTGVFFEADDDWYESNTVIKLLERDGFVEIWRTAKEVRHYDVFMRRGLL